VSAIIRARDWPPLRLVTGVSMANGSPASSFAQFQMRRILSVEEQQLLAER